MKLYGIPNCSTVKKARSWLESNSIAYAFHDFRKNGVTEAMLRGWLTQEPWEKLVNRAGITWRGLPDEAKSAVRDDASAIALMLEKPSVIKRPVLEQNDSIIYLGFDEAAYQKIFNL